ncbi:MAG: ABC-ATPase UvrA, partial [Lachnospiraceae bacterium]|nr:ABC-ATPase UvrA [Lachnospiraceae bacterium]
MIETNLKNCIRIRKAGAHNLKKIDVDIPREKLVVFTGLSGSGKSSLAFDTIYAEGQRRYMESLSSYARQFLGQMEKPDVESIEGLSPAISIDQKSRNHNPRSTVGTVTEIYDYLRLLYARAGIPHCPQCGREIKRQTVDEMVDRIMALPEGTRFQLLAPVVRGRKGEHAKILDQARRSGYVRVLIDGNMFELSEEIKLDKNIKHTIEIVVDRLVVKPGIETRLTDSMENVFALTDGLLTVDVIGGEPILLSTRFACPDCGISIEEIEPRSFSFNNPYGACPACFGLGYKMEFDIDLMIPDRSLSLNQGAFAVTGWKTMKKDSYTWAILKGLADAYGFSLDTPFEDRPGYIQDILISGTRGERFQVRYRSRRGDSVYQLTFEGLMEVTKQRYRECFTERQKQEYEQYMKVTPCAACGGKRLKPSSLAVTVGGKNIADLCDMSVKAHRELLDHVEMTRNQEIISAPILKEIKARLDFLNTVGLDYLTLSRAAATLSGGESQRIRLATQIGSGLVGVT